MADAVKIVAAVLTASDSRTADDDISGRRLISLLESIGADVVHHSVVSDDHDSIRDEMLALSEKTEINLVLTTGGTGLGPRDNTPEATMEVVDREVPGIPEAMRRETSSFTPLAVLSRGVAGTRNGTLIINLPGSPKAVDQCFAIISPFLAHAIRMASGDTGH